MKKQRNSEVESMMASGSLRMYIVCEKCHLRETCINRAMGCTNWRLYKEKANVDKNTERANDH